MMEVDTLITGVHADIQSRRVPEGNLQRLIWYFGAFTSRRLDRMLGRHTKAPPYEKFGNQLGGILGLDDPEKSVLAVSFLDRIRSNFAINTMENLPLIFRLKLGGKNQEDPINTVRLTYADSSRSIGDLVSKKANSLANTVGGDEDLWKKSLQDSRGLGLLLAANMWEKDLDWESLRQLITKDIDYLKKHQEKRVFLD